MQNSVSILNPKQAITSTIYGNQKLDWYNMSGKEGVVPKELSGSATLINAISFDRGQFDNCKTNQDLKRMTGHLTNNSFSHFASVTDNIEKGNTYNCFIVQLENGNRALLWIDATYSKHYKVNVKMQG